MQGMTKRERQITDEAQIKYILDTAKVLHHVQFFAQQRAVHVKNQLALFHGIAIVHGHHIRFIIYCKTQMQHLCCVQNIPDLRFVCDL